MTPDREEDGKGEERGQKILSTWLIYLLTLQSGQNATGFMFYVPTTRHTPRNNSTQLTRSEKSSCQTNCDEETDR